MNRQASLLWVADLIEPALADSTTWKGIVDADIPADLHQDAMDVLGNVYHFSADADIRRKDLEYRLMQEDQARKLVAALRHGASQSELMSLSFLEDLRT